MGGRKGGSVACTWAMPVKLSHGSADMGQQLGRPAGFGTDSFDIFVGFHVVQDVLVENGKRFVVLAPDVRKRFVVVMEDRIGRIDEIPVAGRAVLVEAHAEFPVSALMARAAM